MAWQPGIIITDVPALSASGLPAQLRAFVERPWSYRQRYLQSAYRTAFDGYSFAGQTDSLNQGPEDELHSFVISDFSPRSAFPGELQRFLCDEWPAVTRIAREIEPDLLVQLGVEGLLEPYEESYGHMMSANYYPPALAAQPKNALRLTEHPDVSLLTLFPFGVEAGFEYQDAEGAWHAVAPSNRVVGFAGELLEWLTAGRIRALNHRVAPAHGEHLGARFSFSLFSLPRPGTRIERHVSAAQGSLQLAPERHAADAEGTTGQPLGRLHLFHGSPGTRPEAISVEAYIEAHLSRWL